jgi:hypothetical protein
MLTGLSCLFNYFSFFWLLCLLSLRVRPIGVVYRCSNLFFFFYSIILCVYINIYIYMRACVYICSLLYFDLIKSVSSQASRTSQVSLPSHRSLVLTYIHTCTSCTRSHIHTRIHVRAHKSLLLLKMNTLVVDLRAYSSFPSADI